MESKRFGAIRRMAVLGICALALTILPGTPVWATARAIGARTLAFVGRTVAPAFGRSTTASGAPSIGAAMAVALATDTDGDTKADPNDVIRYTTTITNSGSDATGVHFSSTPPAGTTWGGTYVVYDTYSSVGNMTLDTSTLGSCGANALFSVLCNDALNGGTLTKFGNSLANAGNTTVNGSNTVTTAHGTVKLNIDGSFVYNPTAGYEGDDEFYYTVSSLEVGKATISVGGSNGTVWFVNSTGAVGTGTQASPFNSLASFVAVNNGSGNTPPSLNPANGDTIYLFENSTAYTGAIALLQGQRLIGQDATVSPSSLNGPSPQPGNAYPPNNPTGAAVTITNSVTNTISLATGNTIAGFTVGQTNGSVAVAAGTAGNLSIREVTINSAGGGGFIVITSAAIVSDATFTGFTSITTTAGGVVLGSVTGTLALGSGSIVGTGGGSALSLNGGTVNVSYSGSLSQPNNGALVAANSGHTGTLTLSGTLSATNGTGLQFDNADGTYNVNTTAGTTTLNGGDAGIDITNGSGGTFGFGRTASPSSFAITSPSGAAFLVSGGAPGVTYSGLITQNTAGQRMISVSDTTGGSVTFNSPTANSYVSGGTGILVDGAAGNVTVSNADLNGARGIEILGDATNNATGTFTFTNVTIDTTAGATNHGFIVNGDVSGASGNDVTGVIDLNNVDITNSGGNLVNIAGLGGSGSIDFDSASAVSRSSAGLGIVATSNAGGTITFNSTTKTLNTGANNAVDLTNNTGATINFVNGNLDIDTTTGTGFNATGGGTVTVTGSVNTISSTTGTALNVTNTTIGTGAGGLETGLRFQSISSNGSGSANGLILDTTGSSGGLTVTGNGGTCTSSITCTGGTISNKTGSDGTGAGIGIYLNNTSNPSFTRMKLNDFSNYAVRGTSVTGFTLNDSFIDGVNGDNGGNDEGTIIFDGLFGTSSFSGDTIKGGVEDNFRIINSSGTSAVTIDNCTIRDTSTSSSGNDNVNIRATVSASITAHITNSTFAATNGDHIQTLAIDQSSLSIVATGNTLSGGGGGSALGQGITISGGTATPVDSTEIVRFDISDNTMTGTIQGGAININKGVGNGNWQGQVTNNTIGNAGVTCSGASQSSGVRLESHAKGALIGIVSNNTIRQTCGAGGGIVLSAGDTGASGVQNGSLDATVVGNTITAAASNFDHGIVLVGGAGVTGNTNQICADFRNNSSEGSHVVGSSGFAYRIRQRFEQTVFLPGYLGANNNNATVATYLGSRPNTAIAGDGGTFSVTNTVGIAPPNGPGGGFQNIAQCAQPSLPLLTWNGPSHQVQWAQARDGVNDSSPVASRQYHPSLTARMRSFGAALSNTTRTTIDRLSMPKAAGAIISRAPAALAAARRVASSALATSAAAMARLAQSVESSILAPLQASGQTVDVDLGTLPAGKSITVVYSVTVDAPPVASYANHATITWTNAGTVDTNTVATTGDLYATSTALVSSLNPADAGASVTFTATVTPTEGSTTPDGTVQFKDGGSNIGSVVACSDAGSHTCAAQLTTALLTSATHLITADYLGGTNHDPSSSNTVSQVINACTVNPIVTSTDDAGPGTLRQAIADACGAAGNNIITFDPSLSGYINLSTGELSPTRDVVISGPATAGGVGIARSGAAFRLFHVNAGRSFAISGVTFLYGLATGAGPDGLGGGIFAEGGTTVSVARSSFSTNTAVAGGAIYVSADTDSSLTITDSNFVGNGTTSGAGGALAAVGFGAGATPTVSVTNSTFSLNGASLGGGIAFDGAIATITNATVTGNRGETTPLGAGGISIAGASQVILRNTIVARNFDGSFPSTAASDIVGALDPSSSHNLIGDGSNMTGVVNGSDGNQVGTAGSAINPLLAPYGFNGGPTGTHALLNGSPAIDAGDNTFVVTPPFTNASPITDQRGTGFRRVADGADAGSTATVDIGAYEAQTTIEDVADPTTFEDVAFAFSFNVGDDANVGFDSIAATSSDQAVAPDGNLVITGSGATRTLTITPGANQAGSATITLTASKTIGGYLQTATDTFVLTVTALNDAPTFDVIGNPAAIPEDSAQQTVNLSGISAGGGGESQTLTVTAASNNHALIADPSVTYSSADATGSLTYTPVANASGTATVTVTVQDGGGTANGGVDTTIRTFTVTVDPIADTPSITGATTTEDTQTSSGLVVTKNAVDGAEVTHLKISNVQHGAVYLHDGTTPVADGSFITFAQASPGLTFTPAANFFGAASFDVQASAGNGDGGLGGGIVTATITVSAVADTPSVTPATTLVETQTTSGLVITPDAPDSASVQHFKITNLQHGTLFQHNGTTPINAGAFITVADGAAGLAFTPATGFSGAASFDVQASLSGSDAGLGGVVVTAAITVNRHVSTTTLVSGTPDPSEPSQPITVVYGVVSADGGPVPTGIVTVTISGGSETCSGTVAGGQCTLTPTIAGSRTVTATYGGDTLTAGSSDSTDHTVTVCTADPVVTTNADSGAGSLRQAIADACTIHNTITFSGVTSPIGLTSGTLSLSKNVTIEGPGATLLTVQRIGGTFHVFEVQPGVTAVIRNLTVANGSADPLGFPVSDGGALINLSGTVTIENSALVGNAARNGGALMNYGQFPGVPAVMTVINSTISGNTATQSGGAIYNAGGASLARLTVVNSTISGNQGDRGGGIVTQGPGSEVTIINTTIANNRTNTSGSGDPGGGLQVLANGGAEGVLRNSIVAGNVNGPSPSATPDDVFGDFDQASSGHNLIGASIFAAGLYNGDHGNLVGTQAIPLDARLGPLADNGGPTLTHALLAGSPAIDAGDNTFVTAPPFLNTSPITDQRGTGFMRILDGPDANATGTVDMGALEAQPTVESIAAKATLEDTPLSFSFNVGDATSGIDTIVATSNNPALVTDANLSVTGSGSTRTLTATPLADQNGIATITVTAQKTINGTLLSTTTSFQLSVTSLNDPPTLAAIASPASIPEDSPTQTVNLSGISAGGGESQVLTVTATSNNTTLIPNPTVTYVSANATGSLAYTPLPNANGTATITVTVTDSGDGSTVSTFSVTVAPTADTPSITNAVTNEDTLSGSGLVVTRNVLDGAEVTHFKVIAVSGGLLFLNDGVTPVLPGTFITAANGSAGLRFTPASNSFATGHVTVQASISALDAGLGGSPVTANIQVNPVPDTPSVTPATTLEDTQTSSGLVITRNAADGPEITNFKIVDISNGTLFRNDGTTEIHAGDVILAAQAGAGLRFTPALNFSGTATFHVIGVLDPLGGFNGTPGIGAGTITVTAVADTPSITNAATTVNVQTASGLVVSRNAVDGAEVTHVKVTAISGGTLFQHDGTTSIGAGTFITIAQGAAGLRFTPATNSVTTGHVSIQASTSNVDAGLGGAIATADIVVNPVTSTTTVVTSGSPSNPGQSVTFTATVTPALAAASGTVQFTDGATNLGAPVAVSGGTASFSTSSLAPGLHTITAVYSGYALAAISTGTLAGGQLVRTPVTLVMSSSGNPTPLAQPVTITATPSFSGSGVPGGTMTFKESATTLATVSLIGGAASFTTSAFTLGTHHLTIDYTGDATFAPGSGTFDQVTSCPVMTVGPATIPPAVLGIPYTVTFTQTGGVGATAFALTGTLPAGLSFTAATATLSGVPVAPGSYPIEITATPANGCGAVTASYTLLVGGGRTLLTGADAGASPHVRRFTALDGSTPSTGALNSFFAFEASFAGGARVAEGDVNGDGVPDYIAGAGPGRSPDVRVYDGATGTAIANLLAFEPDFRGGVFVAAGDVNGDGFADVIAGSGEGRSGEVKVYSGRDFSLLRDTFVFARAFTGGIHVAAGDVNGDGLADLLVGTGAGAADVTILNGADGAVLRTFTAYPGFTGGVFVAAGDVTGDGFADVVTGAGAGGAPHVRVLDGRTGADVFGFMAFDPAFTGGARVAVGDVTGDGHAEIIVAAGPGGSAAVRVFDGTTTALLTAFVAYPAAFTGGSFVATAAPLSRMSIDAPVAGSTIRGTFAVTGWAFEEGGTGVGIAGIDVAALPVGGGAPIPLGTAALGGARPDVGAIYGAQYATAGFQLAVTGLAPGTYDLRVTARGARSGTANLVRVVRITVRPEPQPILAIDIPAAGRLSSGDFTVAGWALTLETDPAPGVDAIHVWAAPVGGGAWKFLGSAGLGVPRPDVATVFGSPYAAAGYTLNVTGLAPGTWDLLVFPRATGRAAFAAPQIVRVTVPGGSTRSFITGADAGGGPHVKRFDALDGGVPAVGALSSFFAFDPSFTGGVRVAEGDVTGDGVPDYIAGAGAGGAPEVRIIDGALGAIRASFLAFEPEFRGGVFVAAGDVNGDGLVDVIVGSGEGRRGEIKVFSGRDLSVLRDVFVFDAAFRGGVHVAAGDVNGDGYADLIAGAGAGGTEVLILNATDLSTLWTVTPYAGFLGGAWVAAGDVTGDGFADVITGAGAGGGPHVRVYDGRTGAEARNFFAYEPAFAGGVRVAVGDVNGDGRAEIITGPGPGRAAEARVFDAATAALLNTVLAYPGFTSGVFVATAVPVNRMAIDTPADGAIVHGTFYLAGWAFDEHPSTAGLDAIHVWAFPVAGGSPSFGGVATLGIPRPDVAALYGAQYANAGFYVDMAGLAPGVYDVVVFGHSSVSGTFNLQRVVRVTIAP